MSGYDQQYQPQGYGPPQGQYGAPQGQYGPPQGQYPPQQGYYPQQQQPMQYAPAPQEEKKDDKGCLYSCIAAMCCCWLCGETCECCLDCLTCCC